MTKTTVKVIKSNGETEDFDQQKLRNSLERSGASFVLANEISDRIASEITNESTTSDIYKKAFDYLKKQEKQTAKRYAIRRDVLKMGPTGFPFEQFVAKVFELKGYKTKIGVTLAGKCVEHEIDVMAYDDDDLILAEVKFHNSLHLKTDTKVTLYVKARYDDLAESEFPVDGNIRTMTNGVLVTNTKFTNNARQYAHCVDMGLISWDYPQKGNLYDLIAESGIDPIEFAESLTVE